MSGKNEARIHIVMKEKDKQDFFNKCEEDGNNVSRLVRKWIRLYNNDLLD